MGRSLFSSVTRQNIPVLLFTVVVSFPIWSTMSSGCRVVAHGTVAGVVAHPPLSRNDGKKKVKAAGRFGPVVLQSISSVPRATRSPLPLLMI